MNNITINKEKISLYAKIQKNLFDLEPNSTDDSINKLIEQIPQDFLNQKEDLMIICELFAYYGRIHEISKKKNAIKLFDRIMKYIKIQLQDESSFFWTIFGSHYYFKFWFYEEGLISMEQIILSAQEDNSTFVIEYFLPEIIKEAREIYEKELKYKYKKGYSEDSIEQFVELRKKHFKWLRESADYNDSKYEEIERNRLRLSIKRDDIDTFQKTLSETNLSTDSNIIESALENIQILPTELSLLEYAIEFNSIQIIKFLIMNDAKFNIDMIYFAIQRNIYDVIHMLESDFKEMFEKESLPTSVVLWNSEMTEYSLNNFDFNFLFEKNVKNDNEDALRIICQTFKSFNFVFLESTILPFLDNNPEFVEKNIYEIILETFSDKSCFFVKEFLKYPGIDVNHHFTKYNITFLFKAIEELNINGVRILLNHPLIDVNCTAYEKLSPIQITCKMFSDMKIIKMLCNHPGIEIDKKDTDFHSNAFELSVCCGHFYAAQYFIDNYPDLCYKNNFYLLFYLCLCYRHLFSLKIILKYYLKQNLILNGNYVIDNLRIYFSNQHDYKAEFEVEMRNIFLELNIQLDSGITI